jgi:hypothetical protein
LRSVFLLKPLLKCSTKIMNRAAFGVGAIVVGHKMSGKSQSLEFLIQMLKYVASQQETKFYGFKVSMKTEGTQPPSSNLDLFVLFRKNVLKAGVVDACQQLLCAGLKCADPLSEDTLMCRTRQKYDLDDTLSAQVVAYNVLLYYNQCQRQFESGLVSYDSLVGLVMSCCDLFLCPRGQTYLNGPCFIVIDEVGELLSPHGDETKSILLKVVRRVSEQSCNANSNLFIIFSGSTSLAGYVESTHLQEHLCTLPSFSAEECQELWEAWKTHVKCQDLVAAEAWLMDVVGGEGGLGEDEKGVEGEAQGETATKTSSSQLGPGLLDHSDGVAGCLVELFCTAFGDQPKPEKTLLAMTRSHYQELKSALSEREAIPGVETVCNLMKRKSWLDFANHGLAPSANTSPSAPVLRLLFTLLKEEPGIDSTGKYGDMLRSMSQLNLSGSYTGAVYQEEVMYACLTGKKISCALVSPPQAKCKNKAWKVGKSRTLFENQRALLVKHHKDGTVANPLYIGPGISFQQRAELEERPPLLCFVAESQIFPSIDLSLAAIDHEKHEATLYHCSVSINTRHFAPSLVSKGHLPLDMSTDPPSLLRSKEAKRQVKEYGMCVIDLLKRWKVEHVKHHYAVFDPHAKDLCQPTFPFDKPYFCLSL